MSGPVSVDESIAVTCLRHYGSLDAAIEVLTIAAAGGAALDEPAQPTEVATLKADAAFREAEAAAVKAEVVALKAEVERLKAENQVLRERAYGR